jgi:hypothetical protein
MFWNAQSLSVIGRYDVNVGVLSLFPRVAKTRLCMISDPRFSISLPLDEETCIQHSSDIQIIIESISPTQSYRLAAIRVLHELLEYLRLTMIVC